jgi:hypothetical protein
MKKMKKIILPFLVFFSTMILSSCAKEGCTDSMANNYSSKAKNDDGSCSYDRDAVIGSYLANGTVNCDVSGSDSFSNATVSITASSTAKNKVVMNLDGMLLTLTVSGTSLTIDNQSISGFTYSGTGQLNGNILTLTMTEYDVQNDETCIYNVTGNKQ